MREDTYTKSRDSAKQIEKKWTYPRIISFIMIFALIFAYFFTAAFLTSKTPLESDVSLNLRTSGIENASAAVPEGFSVSVPHVHSAAALLMDEMTGEVLYSKNADTVLPMASTTKIMTAIIILERAKLDEQVVVSEYAAGIGEQSLNLSAGEVLTVEQLLYAIMVQSANDAAAALAEHVGGSIEGFSAMMNEKAKSLGANSTNFTNPHGLDNPDHYTTARDLAVISRYAMTSPKFREIITTRSYVIPWPGNPWDRECQNRNRLLDMMPEAGGIKTGYTNRAGKCFVGYASRDDIGLISVVLNDDDFFNTSKTLLEYGLDSYVRTKLLDMSESLAVLNVGEYPTVEIDIVPERDVVSLMRKDVLKETEGFSVAYTDFLSYPVKAGRQVGDAFLDMGDGRQLHLAVLSSEEAQRPSIPSRLLHITGGVFSSWYRAISGIFN